MDRSGKVLFIEIKQVSYWRGLACLGWAGIGMAWFTLSINNKR